MLPPALIDGPNLQLRQRTEFSQIGGRASMNPLVVLDSLSRDGEFIHAATPDTQHPQTLGHYQGSHNDEDRTDFGPSALERRGDDAYTESSKGNPPRPAGRLRPRCENDIETDRASSDKNVADVAADFT